MVPNGQFNGPKFKWTGVFIMKEHNWMPFDEISVQIEFITIFSSFKSIETGKAVHGLFYLTNMPIPQP